MTSYEQKITRLEANEENMSKQITSIQTDIKEIKDDIIEMRLSLAKYSGAIVVGVSVVQFFVGKFL